MISTFKSLAILCSAVIVFAACSSPKEEIKETPPPPKQEEPKMAPPVEATKLYKYNDRYMVPASRISDATDFNDPLQAIRVIQLRQGMNNVLVISSFDKMMIDGKETPVETWIGIELKSMMVGKYDLATDALNKQFYRFVLSDKGKRFDGVEITGTVEIKESTREYVAGFINASIKGETKGFDQANQDFALSFSGSFKVDRVDLENTLMGK